MSSPNNFDLFGLSPTFEINTTDLQQRLHAMLAQVHPDRFASAHEQEKRLAVQLTAQINEAFTQLYNPLKRAKYLFSICFSGEKLDRIVVSNDFLMLQAQWHEQLESQDNLSELSQTLQQHKQNILTKIAHEFANWQKGGGTSQNGSLLGQAINELSFVSKIEEILLDAVHHQLEQPHKITE